MSSPKNPLEELPPGQPEPPAVTSRGIRPEVEDPPWTGWDVLVIVGTTIGATLVLSLAVMLAAHLFVYRKMAFLDVARIPQVVLLSQLLVYILVFLVMYELVQTRSGHFWDAIRWNWPRRSWIGYVVSGGLVFFVLAGLGRLLPIPKQLPIDRFFENAREAAIISVFAVTVAPLMEELFFRGFLYPVLARQLGTAPSIFLTSVAFGLLHGGQLKYSWAAVLIIFLVGVVLTTVRAITKSVAASFLLHVGYNATLSVLMFVVTDRFRHLERLSQ